MTYEHWNSADALPPVDCPLVVMVDAHHFLRATRTGFLDDKTRDMEYRLADGSTLTGRFRWTYP